jgi:hypothetical protein
MIIQDGGISLLYNKFSPLKRLNVYLGWLFVPMVEVIKWSRLMASIPFAVGITWHHPFWTERREVIPVTVLPASFGGRCGTLKDLVWYCSFGRHVITFCQLGRSIREELYRIPFAWFVD